MLEPFQYTDNFILATRDCFIVNLVNPKSTIILYSSLVTKIKIVIDRSMSKPYDFILARK